MDENARRRFVELIDTSNIVPDNMDVNDFFDLGSLIIILWLKIAFKSYAYIIGMAISSKRWIINKQPWFLQSNYKYSRVYYDDKR